LPALKDGDLQLEIAISPKDEYTPMHKGKRIIKRPSSSVEGGEVV
jgi:hypothetical protein